MALPSSHKLRFIVALLTPSLPGLVVYIVLSLLTLELYKIHSLDSVVRSVTNFNPGQDALNLVSSALSGVFGDGTPTVVLATFWGIVGIVIFTIVSGFTLVISEVNEGFEARNYIWPAGSDRNGPLRSVLAREGFRVAIALTLLLYVVVVVPAIGELVPMSYRTTDDIMSIALLAPTLLFIVQECLILHGVTILVRLLRLQRRVW